MVKLFGPTREVFAVCNNGNTTVTIAMVNAAPPSVIVITLVYFGSYSGVFCFYRRYPLLLRHFSDSGAYGFSERYSSVPTDIHLFYSRSRNELERIVPFPFMKWNQIGTEFGNNFEDLCLISLQERVLSFSMKGMPVGSISVELVLSGNGLQLSRRFCTKLRKFCTRTGIAIIADEILTGFRCSCNPTVLFSDTVGLQPDFIVLGKFIGCGLVLRDKSMTSTPWMMKQCRFPTTNCSVDQLKGMSAAMTAASKQGFGY